MTAFFKELFKYAAKVLAHGLIDELVEAMRKRVRELLAAPGLKALPPAD
jgi:hypothetical protein